MLTCAAECEKDSSLAWRGGGADGRQNTSGSVRGALENRLVLPGSPAPADDLTCLVLVDGVVMASRKWHANDREYTSGCGLGGPSEPRWTRTTLRGLPNYIFEVGSVESAQFE